jgi:hypothetical protein
MHHHHHSTGARVDAAIDHKQITINDAVAAHGVPADAHEEGGEGRGDQLAVEIDAGFDVIISRTGETGHHALAGKGAEVGRRIRPQGHRHPGSQIR